MADDLVGNSILYCNLDEMERQANLAKEDARWLTRDELLALIRAVRAMKNYIENDSAEYSITSVILALEPFDD